MGTTNLNYNDETNAVSIGDVTNISPNVSLSSDAVNAIDLAVAQALAPFDERLASIEDAAQAANSQVDVIIFAGQSNAKGWSIDPLNTTPLNKGYGYMYYPGGDISPLSPIIPGRTQGGPHSAFAQRYVENNGHPVIIIDAAVNGSTILDVNQVTYLGSGVSLSGHTWDLSASNNVYDAWAKPLIDQALIDIAAAGYVHNSPRVIWAQGETDAAGSPRGGQNAIDYQSSLEAIIDRFETDYGIDGFFISLLGYGDPSQNGATNAADVNWDSIRNAQIAASASRNLAHIAFTGAASFRSTTSDKMADTLHYTQSGYNEMGAGLADGISDVRALLGCPHSSLSVYNDEVSDQPHRIGFKKITIGSRATSSTTVDVDFYGDPVTPFAVTWRDSSGANFESTAQTTDLIFPDDTEKTITAYVPNSIGANGAMVLDADINITSLDVDDGVKLNSVNINSSAWHPDYEYVSGTFANFDGSALRNLALNGTATNPTGIALNDTDLANYSGLVSLRISYASTGRLDLTQFSNLSALEMRNQTPALSSADVDAMLADMVANGLTVTGYKPIDFRGGGAPSASGQASVVTLQGRGFTVFTQ